MSTKKKSTQYGFTIVELMIATTVLSIILVMVSIVMIGIGNTYYKGVNQIRVQDDVRNIVDTVSNDLAYSDSTMAVAATSPDGNVQGFCIGSVRYTFVLNHQINDALDPAPYQHVLWRDNVAPGPCPALNDTDLKSTLPIGGSNGTELIGPASSLRAFGISTSSPYDINVAVAYGETSLLQGNGIDTTCIGGIGGQFCATAHLNSTALRRIN